MYREVSNLYVATLSRFYLLLEARESSSYPPNTLAVTQAFSLFRVQSQLSNYGSRLLLKAQQTNALIVQCKLEAMIGVMNQDYPRVHPWLLMDTCTSTTLPLEGSQTQDY